MEVNLSLLENFKLDSNPQSIKKWGEGHIHDTFLVETIDHSPDYILQRINHQIFKNIEGMMSNIEQVTCHLRKEFVDIPGHVAENESLQLVYTKNGNSFFQDDDGEYWRIYIFIPDTITYMKMQDPGLGHEAGKAIGLFQSLLTSLKTPLTETIPDFHNIEWRIRQYRDARAADPAGRAGEVPDELAFVENRFERMSIYYGQLKEKAIIRATHNDTKLNNILFNADQKALCLIDLDTVMPGYVHFDYGDALRTMANTALEDEKDLSLVKFDKLVYDSFTKGYLQYAGNFLSGDEKDLLPYAPVYLTFIIGLRFLTDYLNGDIYYKVHHPGHNLERARVQFKLVQEMEFALNF